MSIDAPILPPSSEPLVSEPSASAVPGSVRRAAAWLGGWFRPAARPAEDEKSGAHALSYRLFNSDLLNKAQRAVAPHVGYLFIFSLFINLLYLSSSLYMMQIYDRVIPGARIETLVFLTLILVLALAALSALEAVRSYILVRMGLKLDADVSSRILLAALNQRTIGRPEERTQAVRDFDSFRGFITGAGISAFLDLPWVPIYLIVIFLLHPLLMAVAVAGMAIMILLAWGTDVKTREPIKVANASAARTYAFVDDAIRNRETVTALRMHLDMARSWTDKRREMLALNARAGDRSAVFNSGTKLFRMLMQSSMLCFGAYLVVEHELTSGSMIAASILMGRALAPMEQAVAVWKGFLGARTSIKRVDMLLSSMPREAKATELPPPTGEMTVERLVYTVSREGPPIIKGVSFAIPAGECVSVIGPSGAGKTTLAKLITGCLPPSAGTVRLDGADLMNWSDVQLRRTIGYIPQDVELFTGTVRDNIARFSEAKDEEVVAAAKAANAHEMILALPKGYETVVSGGAQHLSGGQRQRIGLARALFGEPMLLVLDEPNSHLDGDGDLALAKTLQALKARKCTVILISHRPSTLQLSDKLMVLRDGQIDAYGPTAEVVAKFQKMKEGSAV